MRKFLYCFNMQMRQFFDIFQHLRKEDVLLREYSLKNTYGKLNSIKSADKAIF